jgi:hypothetical protein
VYPELVYGFMRITPLGSAHVVVYEVKVGLRIPQWSSFGSLLRSDSSGAHMHVLVFGQFLLSFFVCLVCFLYMWSDFCRRILSATNCEISFSPSLIHRQFMWLCAHEFETKYRTVVLVEMAHVTNMKLGHLLKWVTQQIQNWDTCWNGSHLSISLDV